MCYYEDELLAIMPLERTTEAVHSHRGLTYAGWLVKKDIKEGQIQNVLESSLNYLRNQGIENLYIKTVPEFFCSESQTSYHSTLSKLGAKILKNDPFFFTSLPYKIQDRGKRWGHKKASEAGIRIHESNHLSLFWTEVLIPCLQERHAANPIHTAEEITLLQSRFPQQIKLWVASLEGNLLAGTVLFLIGEVVHCQYIASTALGRKMRALDALFVQLIEKEFKGKNGISLGTAVLPSSGLPDLGLIHWKKSLGAIPIPVPYFHFDLQSN